MKEEKILVKDVPLQERPRERLLTFGPEQLTNAELLAILLRTGSHGRSALELAQRLLTRFEGLTGLLAADSRELMEESGMGPAKATQVLAALEFGRRVQRANPAPKPIHSPNDVASRLMERLQFLSKEHFVVLHLDTKHRVLGEEVVSVGTLNASLVHPREVFRTAIKRNAAAVVCVHNHPSGDPTPSPEDIDVTKRIVESGRILGIDLVDHVVIGRGTYVSMRERGLI
ncbi:RadC family protein [Kyrpidia tusciae]|uniref:DNA repair protein RadC n=1 Tax=Kyrpidia tusciae (strain DSM 2912 / NBRC 15312 / T2) TaxID=562970 RepID=D5WUP2_KYRT2|nr:DNA repair protein RadC [Kyrpidia tusciae]ADG05432.1 DNA repair protein RadC [Kyrpidia tusciae DSM 2912]MBE3551567.1 DNA repair protein RadC [Kyrpidia tusciae]